MPRRNRRRRDLHQWLNVERVLAALAAINERRQTS